MTTATCCPDSKSPETHQYHPLSSGWAFLTRKWKGSPLSEEIRSEKVCVVVCPGFEYLYQNTPNNGQHCCLRGRQCCLLSSITFISSSKEDNAICFFGNITNLRWPLLLVPLLCELPRSNTGLKDPKKLPNLPSQGRFIRAIGERAANADWRAHL